MQDLDLVPSSQTPSPALSSFERLPDEILGLILDCLLPLRQPELFYCPLPLRWGARKCDATDWSGFQSVAYLSLCSSRLRDLAQPHLFYHVHVNELPSEDGATPIRSLSTDWLNADPCRATTSLHLWHYPNIILPTHDQMPNLRSLHLDGRESYPPSAQDALDLAPRISSLITLTTLRVDYFPAQFLNTLLAHCLPVQNLALQLCRSPSAPAQEGEIDSARMTGVKTLSLINAGGSIDDILLVLRSIEPEQVEAVAFADYVVQYKYLPRWLSDRRWSSLRRLSLEYIYNDDREQTQTSHRFMLEALEHVAFVNLPDPPVPFHQQLLALVRTMGTVSRLAPNIRRLQILPMPFERAPAVFAVACLISMGECSANEVVVALERTTSAFTHPLGSQPDSCAPCKITSGDVWECVARRASTRSMPPSSVLNETDPDSASFFSTEEADELDGLCALCLLKFRVQQAGKRMLCGARPDQARKTPSGATI